MPGRGYDGDPDRFEPARPFPEPREWRIERGPNPETIIIGLVNDELTLGLHPALIYPPMVALSPIFGLDRGWTFEQVGYCTGPASDPGCSPPRS